MDIQKDIIHAKPVSQKLHEIAYFGQSSNFSLRKKNYIIISCKYAQVHSMSLSTTINAQSFKKFCWAVKRAVMTNYFSICSTYNFGKKDESEFPANTHIYTLWVWPES